MSDSPDDKVEEAKAEQLGVRLAWIAYYGLTAAGLIGLLGALVGLQPWSGKPEPSVGGALYLAGGSAAFCLLLRAFGRG